MKKVLPLFFLALLISKSTLANQNANDAIAAGIMLAMIAAANACEEGDHQNYTAGLEMSALPGNAVIDIKTDACKQEELVLNNNLQPVKGHSLLIKPGRAVPRSDTKTHVEIAKDVFGDTVKVTVDNEGFVTKADSAFSHLKRQRVFTPRDRIIVREKTFSQEIIYTGISGNEIYFTYREFIGDSIRYPFTLSLTLDLSKSKTINIKGYEFEVLAADNSEIRYIVKN